MTDSPDRKHLTVTEVNSIARELLENSFMPLWMTGEIGTLMCARSNHVYMTLKDKDAQIRAVMFNGAKALAEHGLKIGSAVEVFGQLSLYVANGEFQFKVQMIRPCGEGDLQKRFEEVKKRLSAEGLFDPGRKRPLPFLPRRIGVITSVDGAALHDFVRVVTRRFPPVHLLVFPAQVQGKNAHLSLIKGIRFLNGMSDAHRPDVLVLTRGGGSIEDLWCFNEEDLARAIAASAIPTVSAVGHEIDFTIADFAADFRAPTPSAAAEQILPPLNDLENTVSNLNGRLRSQAELSLRRTQNILETLQSRLNRLQPLSRLRDMQQRIDRLEQTLLHATGQNILKYKHRLSLLEQRLSFANPQTVLDRGYAYLRQENTSLLIRSVTQTVPGEKLQAVLSDGTLNVQILPHAPETVSVFECVDFEFSRTGGERPHESAEH